MSLRKEVRSHPISDIGVLLLLAVFCVTSLFCVILSVRAFTGVEADVAADADTRLVDGYLRTKIRSHDTDGAICLSSMNGLDCLLLADGDLQDVIYCKDGSLCEQLWDPADDFDPELGETIASVDSLSCSYEAPVLTIAYTLPGQEESTIRCAVKCGKAVQQ